MSNNEKQGKMIVPCDVAIRRFYRMYVTVDRDAVHQEIEDAVRSELMAATDYDAILTPDPDLDIEGHDVLEITPDNDGAWWDDADESGENEPDETASRWVKRESDMRRVAGCAASMLRLARPNRKLLIEYIRPNDKTIMRYTDWQRKSKGIMPGDEYFMVWDMDPDWNTDKPDLLYAVCVSMDSILCAAWELFGLLSKKF